MRRDLEVSSPKEGLHGPLILIRDPRSAELFEFSEEDHFLLTCMDGELGPEGTIARFEERFNKRIGAEQLELFISMLKEWGLLELAGATAEADADRDLILPPAGGRGGWRGRGRGGLGAAGALAGGGAAAEPVPEPAASANPAAQPRRPPRPRLIARPGLVAPDEVTSAEYTERPSDVREHLEAVSHRRGAGGGGGGGGRGPGAIPGPGWEPQLRVDGADEDPFDDPPHWTWFRPQGLFAWFGSWLWPVRYIAYLMPLIVGVGLWTIFSNWALYEPDVLLIRKPLTLLHHVLLSMVTLNILTQTGRGIVAAHMGGQALRFGVRLVFGVWPRFFTQLGGLSKLERTKLLWIHGTPPLLRLAVFGLSAVMWFVTRDQGNSLYKLFLLLSTMGFLSFFFSINPLMRGAGYHLLTVLLDMPDLRRRANMALRGRARGGQRRGGEEEGEVSENLFALKAYALASIIFMLALAGTVMFLTAHWLELNYEGVGVAIFLAVFAIVTWRFRAQIKDRKERRKVDRLRTREARIAELRAGGPRALARLQAGMHGDMVRPQLEPAPAEPKKKGNPFIRWGLLALVIAVMFLPYHYEPGGPVTIMPMQVQELHTEIPGVIGDVYFNGGERVEAGTVIARIASLEEERNVQTTRADLARKQAELEELLSTPRPEDVALARQALETARTAAQFSAAEEQRLSAVYKAGHISLEDYEEVRRRADVDAQQVLEAEANLRRVQAGPHPKEIEALRHEIEGLKDLLAYYESQLEKTALTMPFDGRIVTINLRDRRGQFLEKGDFFAQVENDESVRVQFNIPQSDVSEFGIGAAVRIKIWTYPDRIFTGEVVDIAPVVEEEDGQGSVVKVTSVIPNEDGTLKSGMTGFGKIDGGTKPVIVAFTRAIVRFFLIEAWSWLP
jgi:putative peptide zinc metalloprotease protein